ncbi:mannitol dehydrogenase family protein [Alteromonas sp. 5E99-2]|uniref:mannitol dehydrogenase family protein n=1 Tax=Alteromonas sp. 5E99-2 TaxID=2817683 RepID=UPI001A9934A3|nr:mannitol dehydrogenase family protein [Alteromonas sp. 5E99-2]MBO1255666.1 mannitol dehydrogenase family protein [Alteromonas sp. 5E99-2]
MAIKLSNQSIEQLSSKVKTPNYSRDSLSAGIIHIGIGNFHRAHQAMYMHKLFNKGKALDWGIRGAGIKSYDAVMRTKLQQQDWLTTVVELDSNNLTADISASMIDFIENDGPSLMTALARANIRIVSLTITEGGYFMDGETGDFDLTHPDIQADINDIEHALTVFGLIIHSLQYRREHNIAPFTVLSCDNIPHNGDVAKRAVLEMARVLDKDLASWIESNVSFPNSMVDCITPATSQEERKRLTELFDIEDQAPVFCEPFRQWVLEDNFVNGRPPLEDVGVEFVDDVAPYELMKLRVLNGGHASIAYPGALLGISFVHEVMNTPLIRAYFKKLVTEEIIATLPAVPGVNFDDYISIIETRFSNPEVRDTVSRLCQDASNRLPKFIFPIITANLEHGKGCKGLALVVALWSHLCFISSDNTSGIVLDDPQADRLMKQARLAKSDPAVFLQMKDVFGVISDSDIFKQHFTFWSTMLGKSDPQNTLKYYTSNKY